MRPQALHALIAACIAAASVVACGGSPPTSPPLPPPTGGNGGSANPPANSPPAIDAITVQGRRARQPARFADLRETVDVAATVRDPETALEELVYQWTATAGTFSGTGRAVTWTAPDSAVTPVAVTITLKVIENYGHPGQPKTFTHDTSSSVTVALHDSAKEIGDMSVRFLTEFSNPQTNKDWRDIMRDFKAEACPDPGEVESERGDVERHYTHFFMHSYRIDPPAVSVSFGEACAAPGQNPLRGDGCASVSVRWDSTDLRTSTRAVTAGVDYLAAAYSASDRRWWLCASKFIPNSTLGHMFYSDR